MSNSLGDSQQAPHPAILGYPSPQLFSIIPNQPEDVSSATSVGVVRGQAVDIEIQRRPQSQHKNAMKHQRESPTKEGLEGRARGSQSQ